MDVGLAVGLVGLTGELGGEFQFGEKKDDVDGRVGMGCKGVVEQWANIKS